VRLAESFTFSTHKRSEKTYAIDNMDSRRSLHKFEERFPYIRRKNVIVNIIFVLKKEKKNVYENYRVQNNGHGGLDKYNYFEEVDSRYLPIYTRAYLHETYYYFDFVTK